MKKKQRQMIGMLLALVVLAAAFLGIRQYNKNASSATSTTEDTQETVLDVNSDDITSFRYVYEGETYAFEKEDDTWYYADDHSLNLNQERIKAMILKVAPLKADQVIENVTDMSQYGLADPERTIQYETADRSVIINVGNLNSMTSQYYIAFPSEMKVYVVATNVVTGFNYTLEDLVEVDYDRWSTEADVDRSPLAAHGEYRQDARLGDGDLPELRYEIVTVKLPFLYGLCKRDFIQWVERDNDQLPMEYWEEYRTVTAAPWGAEEVFQRYSGAEPVNQFLLCWPDRMAEVKLPWDWRLTADQMAVIGEKLLHA